MFRTVTTKTPSRKKLQYIVRYARYNSTHQYEERKLKNQLRILLREVAQPVAVVTSFMRGESAHAESTAKHIFHGATLSSFTSIAMDPYPLITFALRIPSRMATSLSAAASASLQDPSTPSHMVVNLLSAQQASIAVKFSRPDLYRQPFDSVAYTHSIRKSRHLQVTSTSKRPIAYHRKSRSRAQASSAPIHAILAPTSYFPAPQPEFNFGYHQELDQTPVEDKMDWIGDKLSMLIEQGKRALGAEVVVMSDAKEDEVDDGTGGWEEEDDPRTHSRSGSVKRSKRPRSILPPSFTNPIPHASSASPRRSAYDSAPTTSTSSSFAPSSAPVSINYKTPHKAHSRGISYESGIGLGIELGSANGTLKTPPSFTEDSSSWDSPEIRESMEKARARYLERSRG